MEEGQLCFVCRSIMHPKYLLSNESLRNLEDKEYHTEEEVKDVDTTVHSKPSLKTASFTGYRDEKFRNIQKTLFNLVLQVRPCVSPEDDNTEMPVKLCDKCETDIYYVCQTQMEIEKLQTELYRVSNSILDAVISSVVESCFSQGNVENYRRQYSELQQSHSGMNMKILDTLQLLPKDSVGGRVYKKWKPKFCKAFEAKLELHSAVSAIEPYIEHYEEEIYTSSPASQEPHVEEPECYEDVIGDVHDEEAVVQVIMDVSNNSQSDGINSSYGLITIEENTTLKCTSIENQLQESIPNKSVRIRKKRFECLTSIRTKSANASRTNLNSKQTKKKIIAENVLNDQTHQCPDCGQQCKRKARLKEHMELYHNQNVREHGTYQCPECLICFDRLQRLECHLVNIHENIDCGFEWCKLCKIMTRSTTDHECKTFSKKCVVCEKDFSSLNSYKLHRKEVCVRKRHGVKGSKYFKCDMCSKTFNRKQGLFYHKKTHTGEKNFTCEVCNKMFTRKNQLDVHRRIHSGEKPFVCEMCGLSFSSTPGLASHKKTHLGIKPYKCDTCNKDFRSLGHLNSHQIIHTGERPFSCTICQKSFNRKENLRSHEYTHATNKPHKCPICPTTSFARANLLRKHMSRHVKKEHIKKLPSPAVLKPSEPVDMEKDSDAAVNRLSGHKGLKNNVRVIKGSVKSIMPNFPDQTEIPSAAKNVAYFIANNPGKFLVLKSVPASQIEPETILPS